MADITRKCFRPLWEIRSFIDRRYDTLSSRACICRVPILWGVHSIYARVWSVSVVFLCQGPAKPPTRLTKVGFTLLFCVIAPKRPGAC